MAGVAVERSTYVQRAYSEIRRLIVEGHLDSGSKVVVRLLAEQLDLSPTPIKNALAGLERDGFLISVPHRGYFVPTVDAGDMREIFELREVLDGIAARKVAARPDRDDVVGVLWDCFEEQSQAARDHDTVRYGEINVAFHRVLWQAARNARLARLADNLVGQLRLATGASARTPGRMECAMDEHRAIIEAVETGDATLAEDASRHHVRLSAEAFLRGVGLTARPDDASHELV